MTAHCYHIHLPWLSDEAGMMTATTLADAALTIADELDRACDFEHESISAFGDSGCFEEAYEAFKVSEALNVVVLNLRTVAEMSTGARELAPLYREEDGATLLRTRLEKMVLAGTAFDELPLRYTPWVEPCTAAGPCDWDDDPDAELDDDTGDDMGPWCEVHHAPHAPGGLACELRTAENLLDRS